MKKTGLLTFGLIALCAQPAVFAQTDSAQKDLPALIQVATANTLVLETKASGIIEYQCSKEKDPLTTYKWTMVGPKAELTDKGGEEVGDYSGPPARWGPQRRLVCHWFASGGVAQWQQEYSPSTGES
jgi:hypothetical protein